MREVEKQTGKTPLALQGPPFPYEIKDVWEKFLELSSTRGAGFNGPSPISYQEIKSWKELTGDPLPAWQVAIIKRLDAIYLRVTQNGRS